MDRRINQRRLPPPSRSRNRHRRLGLTSGRRLLSPLRLLPNQKTEISRRRIPPLSRRHGLAQVNLQARERPRASRQPRGPRAQKSPIPRPISQVLHLRREPPDPGKDHHSAVFYFAAEEPIPSGSLLHRFVNGDDAFRNQRFKIVNRIVKGPWVVKAAVGNYGACLLGKALTCNYHRGHNYFEIDVDICSSAIATAILRLALGYVTSVTIDMGFLAEAQTEEELPERLIGAVRVCQMEMSSAFVVDAPATQQQPCRTLSSAKVNHDEDED
ncbi:hypothetical protein Bca52824_006277 [Brassica carinata]|uniref:Protein ENHANCED DISEASE RESISTANCE 2 C-terminal domain-containing protein n=1 Tax=Brassica carinata TaxID=52824 RepID=A0A8X8BI62_BRACI|nr:hypothetical protein Bca52824_006277 [Brassica carinata]